MSEHSRGRGRAAVVLFGVLLLFGFSSAARAQDCERECLRGLMTQFIDALVAHDPSGLPLADNARYTEDSRNARLGEGLWQSVTANGGFRQDYIDTRKQVAAAHVLLREGETQVLYSVLLHVAGREIAGIESLVRRVTPGGRFQPTELDGPIRGMNDPVPRGQRQSREEMIRIALTYPEGFVVALSSSLNGVSSRTLDMIGTDGTLSIHERGITVSSDPQVERYPDVGETWPKEYRDWFYMMHGMTPQGQVRGLPAPERTSERIELPPDALVPPAHLVEFVDCVRTRRQPKESLEIA